MKEDLTNRKDDPADEPIVIADECGDTMWDAVLEQDVEPGRTNSPKADALLKEIDVACKSRIGDKESRTEIQLINS